MDNKPPSSEAKPSYQYWAFISYSSKDRAWAQWLHAALENYRLPVQLVQHPTPVGEPAPKRFKPLFWDRAELQAHHDLGELIERSLRGSRYLIVICSPNAAKSPWEEKEIQSYQQMHGPERILALLVDGEPNATDVTNCFPPTLRAHEPKAPDARRQGDGKTNAKLMLLATMLGVPFDALKQRDRLRKAKILASSLVGGFLLVVSMGWLAWRTENARQAETAARQKRQQAMIQQALADRMAARDLVSHGRYSEAMAHLAKSVDYAPDSTLAAEHAVLVLNDHFFANPDIVAQLHSGKIYSAHFSPDGSRILTCSSDKTTCVSDTASGRVLFSLSVPNEEADRVNMSGTFSPDGNLIVTVSALGRVCIWDGEHGAHLTTLHGYNANNAVFSPDSEHVLTASNDKTARLWDARTGVMVHAFEGHEGAVECVAFHPDGQRIVTASTDATARLWDVHAGAVTATLTGHRYGVTGAEFSHDGSKVLTVDGIEHAVRVWNAESGELLALLEGHESTINNAHFSPDGESVVTSSGEPNSPRDCTARIWEAATGKLLTTMKGHELAVTDALFSQDGYLVVTASRDKTARVWEANGGKLLCVLEGHSIDARIAQINRDGDKLMTASADGSVRIWGLDGETLRSDFETDGNITSVSPDGQRLADASETIWDSKGRKLAQLEKPLIESVSQSQFSPDGQKILTAASAFKSPTVNWLHWWDADTAKEEAVALSFHRDRINGLWFHPSGGRFATTSDDKTAKIWKPEVGQLVAEHTLTGHFQAVYFAQFSPDGRRIVTVSRDQVANIWDVDSGDLLTSFKTEQAPRRVTTSLFGKGLASLEFSPDGNRIAISAHHEDPRLLDSHDSRLICVYKGSDSTVNSIRFSPDGRHVLTASDDKTACVWDVDTAKPVMVLRGNEGPVSSAEYSFDGKRIVTAFSDGVIHEDAPSARLWDAESGELIAVLRGLGVGGLDTNRARFNAGGQRIILQNADKKIRVWELLGTHAKPPPWFSNFLRLMAQREFAEDGELMTMPASRYAELRTQLESIVTAEKSRYAALARWFLVPSKRTGLPGNE